ncbi:SWI5 [Candida oxycetoniae]|uniref:SWI5 n=1 Tax=Candida oxycetoniae TaxID=497107 RepID=A0AAI9WZ14_9ASCO|nr:SWI5 [Candida oxycetoniae]KAI3405936.2 SWI5 [Candida oxycetoniae]
MDKFNVFDELKTDNFTSNDTFDQFFISDPNEIDLLINETLSGLQDLDVPSGFAVANSSTNNNPAKGYHTRLKSKSHSRQMSGTAIFGFADHNREFSLHGVTPDLNSSHAYKKSVDSRNVSPGELVRSQQQQQQQPSLPPPGQSTVTPSHQRQQMPSQEILKSNFEGKASLLVEEKEEEEEEENKHLFQKRFIQSSPIKQVNTPRTQQHGCMTQPRTAQQNEYIVTNQNPTSYKFPPSPTPMRSESQNKKIVNSYSAKYLQSLQQQLNQLSKLPFSYVDDFEPLLEKDSTTNEIDENNKYVPLPIQEPVYEKQQTQELPRRQLPLSSSPLVQQRQKAPQEPLQQQSEFGTNLTFNTFLPPPTPPTLSNESPDWQSSPEPLSPSPARVNLQQPLDISPIHPNLQNSNSNFYTPMYFNPPSQQSSSRLATQFSNQTNQTINQIKGHQFNQSSQSPQPQPQTQPPNNYYPSFSPFSNINSSTSKYHTSPPKYNQNSPIHNDQCFQTPTKRKQQSLQILEWSPIFLPNSKETPTKQIKDLSPRLRVKKTSLLPPGELDNYWVGPDENKIYKCTYKNCGKLFTRRYNVRSHIQTHLSDRPFGCQFCPKRFVRQHDLNRHLKGHSESRLSKCPCGKEFARLDALKKHQIRNICVGGIKGLVSKPTKKKLSDFPVISRDVPYEVIEKRLNNDLV